jgi:Prenyltransferase, beta subunit
MITKEKIQFNLSEYPRSILSEDNIVVLTWIEKLGLATCAEISTDLGIREADVSSIISKLLTNQLLQYYNDFLQPSEKGKYVIDKFQTYREVIRDTFTFEGMTISERDSVCDTIERYRDDHYPNYLNTLNSLRVWRKLHKARSSALDDRDIFKEFILSIFIFDLKRVSQKVDVLNENPLFFSLLYHDDTLPGMPFTNRAIRHLKSFDALASTNDFRKYNYPVKDLYEYLYCKDYFLADKIQSELNDTLEARKDLKLDNVFYYYYYDEWKRAFLGNTAREHPLMKIDLPQSLKVKGEKPVAISVGEKDQLNIPEEKPSSSRTLKTNDIDKIVREGLLNFKMHYRQLKGRAGWHQYLGAEKIGVVATAQALLAFRYFNADFPFKQKAEETLLRDQIKSKSQGNTSANGGWGYVTNFPGIATTEATCWALQALQENYASHPKVQDGLGWLIANAVKGKENEGWGIIPGDSSRVYSTCLALRTLFLFGKSDTTEYENGLKWLFSAQNKDKGWGSGPGCSSGITYTSRVIVTLMALGYDNENDNLKSGIQWLKKRTQSLQQTKVNAENEYRECIEFGNRRLYFHHTPIQSALTALILSDGLKNPTVFDGVRRLIRQNNNCYWSHPFFAEGTRKPLWVIFETLTVFKALKERTPDYPSLKTIRYKENKIIFWEKSSLFNFERFQDFISVKGLMTLLSICVCLIIVYLAGKSQQVQYLYPYIVGILTPFFIKILGYYLAKVKEVQRTEKLLKEMMQKNKELESISQAMSNSVFGAFKKQAAVPLKNGDSL